MQTAPLELRKLREERLGSTAGLDPAGPHLSRRLVPVSGTGPAKDVGLGDIAVLDRSAVGRRSLVRLADELALRGAAGLVVSQETVAPLPADLRRSIEDRIPLLVVDADWDRARAWLLEVEPSAANMHPDSVLRAILRGTGQGGPLPGELDPSRPTHAIVVVAYPEGRLPAPITKLEELASAEAQHADPRSYTLSVEGTVAILSGQYGKGHDGGEALGRAILHRATSSTLASGVTVGIGRSYSGIRGLRRTFREAKWAATVGEMLWGGNRVVSFRELGIYGLLEPFVTDPTTTDTQDVEKLLDYDRQNQTALLPTVEAYFDAGRSGDAAASLFVHRNTIAYRLRAVKRVTGLDIVNDPDARLLLEVQIRLARLWGILPAAPAAAAVQRSRRGRS